MRLISDFHDYYDGVQKTQYDQSGDLWIRKTKFASLKEIESIVNLLKIRSERSYESFKSSSNFIIRNGYLVNRQPGIHTSCLACWAFIADQCYPFFKIIRKTPLSETIQYIYSINEFEELNEQQHFYRSKLYPKWFFQHNGLIDLNPWALLDSPIFLVYPKNNDWRTNELSIEINPCLKDIDFYKVVDPYTLWQQIDLFLRNQLVKEFNPDVVDEQVRYIKHGFDKKWSFRKRPKFT